VSGLEYDVEHVFRFAPKPGKSEFVAQVIRHHVSKLLAVIVDQVEKSVNDELRMYKFIAAVVAQEDDSSSGSHPCGRGFVNPDPDMGLETLMEQFDDASAAWQAFRDAPFMQKPAGRLCASGHPIPVPHSRTCPAIDVAPRRPDLLQPLQGRSCTAPPHHEHRSVQTEEKRMSHSDEDENMLPVAPPGRSGSSTFARRGNYVRSGRVVAMDLSEFVIRDPEANCDLEDVKLRWRRGDSFS